VLTPLYVQELTSVRHFAMSDILTYKKRLQFCLIVRQHPPVLKPDSCKCSYFLISWFYSFLLTVRPRSLSCLPHLLFTAFSFSRGRIHSVRLDAVTSLVIRLTRRWGDGVWVILRQSAGQCQMSQPFLFLQA